MYNKHIWVDGLMSTNLQPYSAYQSMYFYSQHFVSVIRQGFAKGCFVYLFISFKTCQIFLSFYSFTFTASYYLCYNIAYISRCKFKQYK